MSTTYGPGRFEAIVDRSITEIESNAKTIGLGAFYGCTQLASAKFPKATSIGRYAFNGCTSLTNIELPNVTSIGDYAFFGCTKVAEVDFSNVTSVGQYAFSGCTSLSKINVSHATTINNGAFQKCSKLTSIDLPWLYTTTSLKDYLFDGCTNLTQSFIIPNITSNGSIGSYTFQGCRNVPLFSFRNYTLRSGIYTFSGVGTAEHPTTIVLPKLSGNVDTRLWRGTNYIDVFEIGGVTSLDWFGSAGSINTLIIRGTTMPAAADRTISVATSDTKIYVPSALLSAYQNDSVWSTKNGTFLPIEGSQYENYYADGTPIT